MTLAWRADRRPGKVRKQLGEIVDQQVRRILREAVATESVCHGADPGAGIARGLDVDFGIADDHRLGGRRAEFVQNRIDAHGVGLFALEAVAAIYHAKVIGHAQFLDNTATDPHRLICVDSHRHALERIERFTDAGI